MSAHSSVIFAQSFNFKNRKTFGTHDVKSQKVLLECFSQQQQMLQRLHYGTPYTQRVCHKHC